MSSSTSGHPGHPSTGGAFYGGKRATLAQIGGAIGIASNCIGWGIFLAMCHGLNAAVFLSPIVLISGILGLIITVIGAIVQKHAGDVDPHVLAAILINVFGIVGGLLQVSAWMGWHIMR